MTAASSQRQARTHARRPRWPYRLRQAAWAGLDLLFTPQCAGCQTPGTRWCHECAGRVQRLGLAVCTVCGYPLRGGGCYSGQHPLPALAGVRSAARYGGPLQAALHRLKYKRDIILADTLAGELAAAWQTYALPEWTVMPVPLAATRLHERGYNQAALLARGLADLVGLPYQARGLTRVRQAASQVGLPAEARRRNVLGAFAAERDQVAGRSYILVDDICTTGATLAACAEALREAGATAVWGLTLGRALAAGHTAEAGQAPRHAVTG